MTGENVQAQIDAGTATIWDDRSGLGLRLTPTPDWPAVEKTITWERTHVEAEAGAAGNVVMVPAVKGSYSLDGQQYAIAVRVRDRYGNEGTEDDLRHIARMALRIDYAARLYEAAAEKLRGNVPSEAAGNAEEKSQGSPAP